MRLSLGKPENHSLEIMARPKRGCQGTLRKTNMDPKNDEKFTMKDLKGLTKKIIHNRLRLTGIVFQTYGGFVETSQFLNYFLEIRSI